MILGRTHGTQAVRDSLSAVSRPPGSTLVLGGSGFLGAHVVALASRTGAVTSACREPARTPDLGAARAIDRREVDATRPGGIEALLEELAPARIVNCAALGRIPHCEERPDLARALNADLPGRLARWSARHGARFVHVSTDLVFGREPPPEGGFREEDRPSPIQEYGRSKAAGEQAVLAADPCALVVRLPLLCGFSGGRGLGASDALLAARDRGETPTLFTDEWRTPLDVRVAASALVELLLRGDSGLLHAAGADRVSRHEIGLLVLGRARVRPGRRGELRPEDVSLDSRRARGRLVTPLPGIRETLSAGRGSPAPS